MKLCPVNVTGQLYIAGDGLAHGYLNDPEKTQGVFVNNPYEKGERLYKTGDLVRRLPGGHVEFLGRVDHQVKIRGFRVESGEIENRLLGHEDIKDAVVLVKEDPKEEAYLCAYIVSGKTFAAPELREYLAGELPGFMIPAHFVQLEKIPMTPGGKVDRKALLVSGKSLGTGVQYVSPGNEIEKNIAAVWKELLGLDKVGVHDNFFDIGGNSLSMIRLSSRLKKLFKKDIPMVTLFNYPTIASLGKHLSGEQVKAEVEGPVETREGTPGIAVIGMSGRFPGAKNIEEFWNNLKNGIESITFFSNEELTRWGVGPQLKDDPDYIPVKGVLEGIEYFDSSFFGYTPKEAGITDPQMRIFHECCWEALEDAAYDPDAYDGVIGLYAGASPNPYWEILPLVSHSGSYSEQWDAIQFSDKDYLSTRIAYKLNLKGPGVTMQTACSTSLVAVDLACQALMNGKCHIALAGGVSVTFQDNAGYLYQEGTIMSPDGHCRAFDAAANGTVGGNGAGVVVLKSLEHALADRDHIYAVIKGFAINNDGKNKVGFTAPSIEGQAKVIREARQMAGVEPDSISCIEAHGTGTSLGDPIEIEGLKKAFNTDKKNYCAVGSVKTNIGHLDAAAGIAGFIKTVLALYHRLIPPSLHFKEPNPGIDFENSPFYINTGLSQWKNDNYPLRAEEWPGGHSSSAERRAQSAERKEQLILLSAKTQTALEKMTQSLVEYFKKDPGIDLADAAYTLQTGRRAFKHRRAVVCSDIDEAVDALSSAGGSFTADGDNKPVIFMFSGQGSQYINMGSDLYRTEPQFRENMDRGFEILKSLTGENIKEILYPSSEGTEKIHDVIYSGPAKFLFEYSLSKLVMKWGIQPYAMIGHSFGEYVAACLSGVFSLEDGLKMAVLRGTLMEKTADGAMLSVPLCEEELKPLLRIHDQLSLAAVNSPSLCIVSGPPGAVETLEKELSQEGKECIRINFPRAGHSKMMLPVLKEFEENIRSVTFNEPQIPYISGLTGTWLENRQAVDPAYWTRHLKETIRFSDGLNELLKEPEAVFIEVGPGRGLTLFLGQHPHKKSGHLPLNLVRHRDEGVSDVYYTLSKLGELWSYGIKVDWKAFHAGEKRYRISLPTYPFEQQHYPVEADLCKMENRQGKAPLKKKPGIKNWFYTPSWKRVDLSVKTGTAGKHGYLVFADDCGAGIQLADRLRSEGYDVVSVRTGSDFKKSSDTEYIINPHDGTGYMNLFDQLKQTGKNYNKIVHCWGITNQLPGEFEYNNIEPVLDLGFFSLFFLAKAVGKLDSEKKQIVVITNNIQEVTGEEELVPLKSTVLGAVKVIPREYPHLSCRSIDITGTGPGDRFDKNMTDRLLQEFHSQSNDPIIAFRGKHRWVQCYEARHLEEPGKRISLLKEGGVYLITGGLGGIGLTLAAFLAKNYRAKLVLVGRSASPAKEESIAKMLELETSGGEVLVRGADVSDFQQVREIVKEAVNRFGPVNGIIHTAGAAGGGMVEVRTREEVQQVLRAKVNGTLVLDAVFKDAPPDFFVLCSSLSTVTAPFGQADYCAANIFLDTFAHQKMASSPGKPHTVSINWNTWKEVGMAVKAIEELEKSYGSVRDHVLFENDILPGEGVEVFARILRDTQPQVLVSTIELDHFIEHVEASERFLRQEAFHVMEQSKSANRGNRKRPDISAAYAAPRQKIEKTLAQIWQDLFGIEPVGIDDDFFQLGGDSLKAVIVSAKIHKALDVKIPLKLFFSNPTIRGLSQYITNAGKRRYSSLEPVEKKEYYLLSSAQKRMYVLNQVNEAVTSYNNPSVLELEGELDAARFEHAFTALITRHESFRTSFELIEGEPVQKIHKDVVFELESHVAWSMELGAWDRDSLHAPCSMPHASFVRPFDLAQAPLLRIGLIKGEENKHILMVDMHHIISDGVSIGILIKEFMSLYEGKALRPLTLQYKDYAESQVYEQKRGAFKQQETYWLKQLEGELPSLDMPTDFPRPEAYGFEGRIVTVEIDRELTGKTRELASVSETTLYILLLAAFNVLLFRYTQQEDIIVGSVTAGRTHPDLENIIGMFVNMLAMRNKPRGDKVFRRFLAEVKTNALKAFDNQEYPFEELVEKLDLPRQPGRHPLVDTVFAIQNMEMPEIKIPGLKLKPADVDTGVSKFDLLFLAMETGAEGNRNLRFDFEYRSTLYKQETIERMSRHLINILREVADNPEVTLAEIKMLDQSDKEKIVKQIRDKSGTLRTLPVENAGCVRGDKRNIEADFDF
jgi:acyl transferase domain-containing protein/acyl carrier protein